MKKIDLENTAYKKDDKKNFIRLILDIIYPQNLSCVFCKMPISRSNKYSVCKSCYDQMVFIINACPKCGKPIINTSLKKENDILDCDYCRNKSTIYDRNISFLEYEDKSKHLVFDLKYNSKTFLANNISDIMTDMLKEIYPDVIASIDYITYVPMSKKRSKDRGFNQAGEIAKRLGKNFDIECLDMIDRTRDTRKLHGLNADDRKRELRGVFKVQDDYTKYLEDRVVAVVDDIFTSGSTLNEIAKVLKLSGAKEVIGLTFLTGKYEKPIIEYIE